MVMEPTVFVFQHVPHEHMGTLAKALSRAELKHRQLDVWKNDVLWPDVEDVRALIVMGGPMGVYEEAKYPFLAKEIRFIQDVIKAGRPLLGICLGSQLIAKAFGARVFPNAHKEIGWYAVHMAPAAAGDALFGGWSSKPEIFQWHGDTFDLPAGAELLATSPLCRHQAYRVGKNVYGLQFHPEVDAAMIASWLGQPGTDEELKPLGPTRKRDIAAESPAKAAALEHLAAPAFDAFAQLCAFESNAGVKAPL